MASRRILHRPSTRSSFRGTQKYVSDTSADIVSIETLRISMRKRPLANLNNTLLDRLVRTGLLNICFTERQKLSLLNVAGIPPPPIFHQSMLEVNLVAVGQCMEVPKVHPLSAATYIEYRL